MLEIKNKYRKIDPMPTIPDSGRMTEHLQHYAFNEGATAYHEAVVKWLWEPCTEHPIEGESQPRKYKPTEYIGVYPDHRYLCPDCMKEFKGK